MSNTEDFKYKEDFQRIGLFDRKDKPGILTNSKFLDLVMNLSLHKRFIMLFPIVTLVFFNLVNMYSPTYTFNLPNVEIVSFLNTSISSGNQTTDGNIVIIDLFKDVYRRLESGYLKDIDNMGMVVLPKLIWYPSSIKLQFEEKLFNFGNYSVLNTNDPIIQTSISQTPSSVKEYFFDLKSPNESSKAKTEIQFLQKYVMPLYAYTDAPKSSYSLQPMVQLNYEIKLCNFVMFVTSIVSIIPLLIYPKFGDCNIRVFWGSTVAFGILIMVVMACSFANIVLSFIGSTLCDGAGSKTFILRGLSYLGQLMGCFGVIFMLLPTFWAQHNVFKEKQAMALFEASPEISYSSSFYETSLVEESSNNRKESDCKDIQEVTSFTEKIGSDGSCQRTSDLIVSSDSIEEDNHHGMNSNPKSSQSLDPLLKCQRPSRPHNYSEIPILIRACSSATPRYRTTPIYPLRCSTAPLGGFERSSEIPVLLKSTGEIASQIGSLKQLSVDSALSTKSTNAQSYAKSLRCFASGNNPQKSKVNNYRSFSESSSKEHAGSSFRLDEVLADSRNPASRPLVRDTQDKCSVSSLSERGEDGMNIFSPIRPSVSRFNEGLK